MLCCVSGAHGCSQSFAGYMFGLDALELALSNIIAVTKSRTAAGFIPGWSSGTVKTRAATQPPITSKALAEVRWHIVINCSIHIQKSCSALSRSCWVVFCSGGVRATNYTVTFAGIVNYQVARRWRHRSPALVEMALELCFDDLFIQNTWMYTQRREQPLGLLAYGSSTYVFVQTRRN